MSARGPLFLAAGLVAGVLALALVLFGRAAERGSFAEAYSTFRATPDGAKAAYEVLERLGWRVARHTEAAIALDGVDVFFVLEPAPAGGGHAGVTPAEVRALRRFVHRGGHLVVASTTDTPLHAEFGVRLLEAAPDAATATEGGTADRAAADVVPALAAPETAGLAHVSPDDTPRALEPTSPLAVPILRRAATGAIEAVSVSDGKGKAIFLADPSPFANRALARPGNAALLAGIAGASGRRGAPGVVAFDEFHHGFEAERGVAGYLARRSLGPALMQATAALLVLALALGGRRGRAPILEDERPPESREHVRAMAELHAKARLRRRAVERLHAGILRDVEAALGAPALGEPAAEALRRRGVKGWRGLERLAARRAELLRSGDPGEHELLLFARDLARFERDCREALGQRFGET